VLSWLLNLSKVTNTILVGISSILGIISVLGLSFYIQDEKFYKDEFKKLDASPAYFKLILFGGSLLSLIIGGYILYMILNITM
jgi:putative flippase GtrA